MPAPVNNSMASTIKARYAAGVTGGLIEPDPAQLAVVDNLGRLEAEIAEHRLARKSSSLGWMFGSREKAPDAESRAFMSTATSAAAKPC